MSIATTTELAEAEKLLDAQSAALHHQVTLLQRALPGLDNLDAGIKLLARTRIEIMKDTAWGMFQAAGAINRAVDEINSTLEKAVIPSSKERQEAYDSYVYEMIDHAYAGVKARIEALRNGDAGVEMVLDRVREAHPELDNLCEAVIEASAVLQNSGARRTRIAVRNIQQTYEQHLQKQIKPELDHSDSLAPAATAPDAPASRER